MASISSCPACDTPLGLFTPREVARHINECLDAQHQAPRPSGQVPTCGVCNRDLTVLTPAARAEHANRCADSLLPLGVERAPRAPSRPGPVADRPREIPEEKPKGDERMHNFLKMLGLERYAQKFADEEIDLPALRLLEDSDLAQLRIPDTARRRIAESLTAVPIVAQLQRGENGGSEATAEEAAVVPTQRFGTSRLAERMRRREPLFELDGDSDGEYVPTPVPPKDEDGNAGDGETTGEGRDSRVTAVGTATPNIQKRVELQVPNEVDEIERNVRQKQTTTDESDVSSLDSDISNVSRAVQLASQISVEAKLRRWRNKQIEREEARHKRELEQIEAKYAAHIASAQKRSTNAKSQLPEARGRTSPVAANCETIDLTQDGTVEDDGSGAGQRTQLDFNDQDKSIIISSNERSGNSENESNRDGEAQVAQNESDASSSVGRVTPSANKGPDTSNLDTQSRRHGSPDHDDVRQSDESGILDLITPEGKGPGPNMENRSTEGNPEPAADPDMNLGLQLAFGDESEEEVMDLLNVEKENGPEPDAGNGQNTNESPDESDRPLQEANKRPSTERDSNMPVAAPTQSRLKKRPKTLKVPKATDEDITNAIRADRALYETILAMESVPFDLILSKVRRGGRSVSKKALYEYLTTEGVMFKWESAEPGSKKEAYLHQLNSGLCPD